MTYHKRQFEYLFFLALFLSLRNSNPVLDLFVLTEL